ncbi:MAG: dihydrodipicolinate synthase family protein [Chloroherpetonaceae bacterium]|nr:dihydrodipicolinate synthase family protein [Chloroherpetonaceae bacterium]
MEQSYNSIVGRNEPQFRGCYVANLTPFDHQGSLNTAVLQAHVDWLIAHGIAGLCPAGTTGEFLYLTEYERAEIIEATLQATRGRARVIAGVWALDPGETVRLARHAHVAGADAVFLPPPIYYPATDDHIFACYAAVRSATPLPVFAYNIPQYAANEISLSCLERLIADGVIAGIKESSGDTHRLGEIIRRFGAHATVLAASDALISESRRLGAHGFISAIGNLAPETLVAIWNGDDSRQSEITALRTRLKQIGAIPALKYLLTRKGFSFGNTRIPFAQLTPAQQEMLDGLPV